MLYNLREYHRPSDLDEAVRLLQRPTIATVALAGGVCVVGEGSRAIEAVVDLGGLGLDFLAEAGDTVRLGATLTLQTVIDRGAGWFAGALAEAASRMAGLHIRNAATLGGVLAGGDVNSPLSVVLAAVGARVETYDGKSRSLTPWIELAPRIMGGALRGSLITAVVVTCSPEIGVGYAQVARTPADRPIVCAAAAVTALSPESIASTVVLGGLRVIPVSYNQLLESAETGPYWEAAAARAAQRANDDPDAVISDFLGSAEYRQGVAPVLASRALQDALSRAGLLAGR